MSEIVKDALCPFCGCLCDDIVLEVEDNHIISVNNACTLGEHKFLESGGERALKGPMRREGSGWKPISYEEAIEETAEILLAADRPLLYGWSGTYTEAQGAGIMLAEDLGAIVDSTTSVCHGPSILAIQEVGHPGCTLGQVKNRADVVIYWGSNPQEGHPRHLSRYTTYCDGYFLDNAAHDRTVIVVDVRKSATATLADHFIQIKPGGDYAVLSAMRAILAGREDVIPSKVAGVTREELIKIVNICKNARFGSLFFGVGLTMSQGKYKNVRNAIEFVDDLNRSTKFTLTPMRGHYNVYGFNEVCTWMTGYPYAVDLSRGIAFYNPGETTAVDVLARKECDACLVIASDPGAHFPSASVGHLAEIPTVLIDPVPNLTTPLCRLQIPVAVTGVDVGGTAYRMDGVPLSMKKVIDRGYPTDEELINAIRKRVEEVKGI